MLYFSLARPEPVSLLAAQDINRVQQLRGTASQQISAIGAKIVATAGTALTRALSCEVILLAPAEGTVCAVAFSV